MESDDPCCVLPTMDFCQELQENVEQYGICGNYYLALINIYNAKICLLNENYMAAKTYIKCARTNILILQFGFFTPFDTILVDILFQVKFRFNFYGKFDSNSSLSQKLKITIDADIMST